MTKEVETEKSLKTQECTTPYRDRASIFSHKGIKRNETQKRCVIIHNFKTIHCMFWAYPSHHRFSMFDIMLNQSVDIVLDKIRGSLRYPKTVPTVVKL